MQALNNSIPFYLDFSFLEEEKPIKSLDIDAVIPEISVIIPSQLY